MSISLEGLLAILRGSSVNQEDKLEQILNRLAANGQRLGVVRVIQLLQREDLISSYQANCLYAGESIVFGEYTVLDKLAETPIGHAFIAQAALHEKPIRILLIDPQCCSVPAWLPRFNKYVDESASLKHSSLAKVYESGVRYGRHYLVTDLSSGISLKEYLDKRGPMIVKEALTVTLEVAKGLWHAHERGVIHGGVNPQNLIQTFRNDWILTNFAVTRLLIEQDLAEETSDIRGERLASFDTVSPEQARSPQSLEPGADIYGLGCTLFHLLTGKPPFRAKTLAEKIQAHCNDPLPSLVEARDELPVALQGLVERMTAKDPRRRIASMDLVVAAIQHLLQQDTASATADQSSLTESSSDGSQHGLHKSSVWSSRKLVAGISAAVVCFFLVVGLIWYGEFAINSSSMSRQALTSSVSNGVQDQGESNRADLLKSRNDKVGEGKRTEIPGLTTDRLGPLSILSFVISKKTETSSSRDQSSVQVGTIRRLEQGKVISEHEAVTASRSELSRLSTLASQGEQLQIKQIDLSFTTVRDEELKTLSTLEGLTGLSLQHCANVTDAGIVHLSQLRNLQSIDLRGTNVTAEGVKQLPNGPLQTMMFDAFQGTINGSVLPELASRYDASISTLLISGVPLNEEDFRWLEALRNLRELDVAGTGVSSEWLQYIENLETLENLNLAGNQGIDEGSLPYLSKMNRLTQLNLSDTSITSREAFEQMLACQIVWE